MALLILVLLILLFLVVLFLNGRRVGETGSEQIERADAPTVEQTSGVTDEQTVAEEETVEEEANE